MSYSLVDTAESSLLREIYEKEENGELKWTKGQFRLNDTNYISKGLGKSAGWIEEVFLDQQGQSEYALGKNERDQPSIFSWNVERRKWEYTGPKYELRFKTLGEIFTNVFSRMTSILPKILLLMLLEAFVAFIVGVIIAYINPYGRLGASFNAWFFRRIQGILGTFLGKTQIFNVSPDDNWYIERSYIYDFDISRTTKLIKELYIKRWHDIFFLPAALIIFLLTTLNVGTLIYDIFNIQVVLRTFLPFRIDDQFVVFLMVSIVSIFVTVLLSFYYPMVWAYSNMGLKKFRINPHTGDVDQISNLGVVIRSGIEIFFGFTTLLSLGEISTELHFVFNPTAEPHFREILSSMDISLAIWDLLFSFIGALAFFLIIIAFAVPIIITVSYFYFSTTHMKVIAETRKKLVLENNVNLGTINSEIGILQNDDVIQLYLDDETETIEYT